MRLQYFVLEKVSYKDKGAAISYFDSIYKSSSNHLTSFNDNTQLWIVLVTNIYLHSRNFPKLLIHSRLKRNVMTVSHTSYPHRSAVVVQFFLCYHGTFILHLPKVLLRKFGRYRQHSWWIRNLSCILLQPQCRLSLNLFGDNPYSRKTRLKVFLLVYEKLLTILKNDRLFQTET